jgi:hypothetical protein
MAEPVDRFFTIIRIPVKQVDIDINNDIAF